MVENMKKRNQVPIKFDKWNSILIGAIKVTVRGKTQQKYRELNKLH